MLVWRQKQRTIRGINGEMVDAVGQSVPTDPSFQLDTCASSLTISTKHGNHLLSLPSNDTTQRQKQVMHLAHHMPRNQTRTHIHYLKPCAWKGAVAWVESRLQSTYRPLVLVHILYNCWSPKGAPCWASCWAVQIFDASLKNMGEQHLFGVYMD